jgi:hypothetical protein
MVNLFLILDTVKFSVDKKNGSITLNFVPYTEEAYPEITPEYFFYLFKVKDLNDDKVFDAQQGDVCLLGSMTPYLRYRPYTDKNLTVSSLSYTTGKFEEGE